MTAREFFESARAAQRRIDGRLAAIRAMREREGARAQSYEAIGRGTGASDPMRPVDARIDAEADALAELAQCEREVESARAVCRGVRAACPHNPVWGDVLELRYIELFEWDRIGRALGMTGSGARQACGAALDWVDAIGIAAARDGCGQAALL